MAYNKQNFLDGQVLKAEHLNHMEEGFENLSWNDLKHKPFGSIALSDSCSFAAAPAVYFDLAGQMKFYKISDLTPDYNDLLHTVFTLNKDGTATEVAPKAEEFMLNNETVCCFATENYAFGVAYATGEVETDYGVITLPETGTYMGWAADSALPATMTVGFRCEYLKQMDEKYLPEISGADGLPQVTADDNGKLLQVVGGKWAAVTIANGNGVAY